jgi:predicted Zn-dependent protease
MLDNDKRREEGRESLMYGSSSGYKTMGDCETAARNHLAQNLINTTTGEDGQAVLLSSDERADHRRYVEWQYLYKAWKAQGKTDSESHELASYYKTPPGYVAHYEDSIRFLRS